MMNSVCKLVFVSVSQNWGPQKHLKSHWVSLVAKLRFARCENVQSTWRGSDDGSERVKDGQSVSAQIPFWTAFLWGMLVLKLSKRSVRKFANCFDNDIWFYWHVCFLSLAFLYHLWGWTMVDYAACFLQLIEATPVWLRCVYTDCTGSKPMEMVVYIIYINCKHILNLNHLKSHDCLHNIASCTFAFGGNRRHRWLRQALSFMDLGHQR